MKYSVRMTASLLAATILAAGCNQVADSQSAAQSAVQQPVSKTMKPGAAVGFSHVLRHPVAAGETGVVDFTVSEDYDGGTLVLEARGADGLNVFGASVSARYDMAAGAVHTWSVRFSADADGVYYLNASALVEPGEAPTSRRGYGVRVEVGDASAAVSTNKSTPPTMMPSGEAVIIMQAEETIE